LNLLDGKIVSAHYKSLLQHNVNVAIAKGLRVPHLAAVLVGSNPASEFYVQSKMRSCKEVGFHSSLISKDENITESELVTILHQLNSNDNIDGYIVQLPLPKHIDESKIIQAIAPSKDVDGFHPINIGKLVLNQDTFISATPLGITKILEYYHIPTSGKHCVIIGRSHIVGMPMGLLMLRNSSIGNSTVTYTHSRTENLKAITSQADILIAAIGKPNYITADMIKNGAIVIDVGINRINDESKKKGYRIVGDVDFESVKNIASYITPVPGGVGLMTVIALLLNTWKAYNNTFLIENHKNE